MRTYVFVALLGAASLATLRGATLNVRDLCALADDRTNDVPAFKKAIGAAQKDGPDATVFVLAEGYRLEPSPERNQRHRAWSNVTTATAHGRR